MFSEMEFYKNIVENLPEGVVICDSEKNIIDVNKIFEELTGFSKEEIINKKISDFVKGTKETCNKCSKIAAIPENCVQKSYYIAELKDKDDKFTCVRINISTTKDNRSIYLIIPLADVAFLNHAHIDFVSTVSHELRTPLTSIKGFADTLINSGDKLSQEQQKRFLHIIKSQIERLARLVENLLTVSKLEAKKDKSIYKAIELSKFFENIINNIQAKAQNHKIEVNILPNLPPVWADSDKFEQIMTNLIDNALKYSNNDTKVKISAGFVQNNTEFIKIDVEDQGVGIPEEYLPKIFTKFSRIDNPLTRHVEGTGLGLYITKSLIENIGGKISVKSNKTGSIFSVTIPVSTHEKPAKMKF